MAHVKKTRLNDWHLENGANMADFGGYEMPLWYPTGARAEHLAVLKTAGLFDTSHMAMVAVEGVDAASLLQKLFSKDLDRCIGPKRLPLAPGRCAYGVFADHKGHVIDDAIVYMVAKERYLIVVNAGMGKEITSHLKAFTEGALVTIRDLTDQTGKLDVQGPAAGKILASVLMDPDTVFDGLPYFSFKGHFDRNAPESSQVLLKDGTPVLLSRTGYTGEFGFEIFTDPDDFVAVWQMFRGAGEALGLVSCGLAARDSLRGGAVLPLSHQDIGHWPFVRHPWPFALPFTEDGTGFTKSFHGDGALLAAMETAEHTCCFVGKDLRKVTAGEGSEVWKGDRNIGTVLTCVTDMGIGMEGGTIYSVVSPDIPEGLRIKGLSCGFVKVTVPLAPGEEVFLKDAKRRLAVRIVEDVRPHRTARIALKKML